MPADPARHPDRARCSVFIATSVDGYIARADGGIDWLERANAAVPAGEDCGYATFMTTVDAIVMGRLTFETVRSLDPWPYGRTPVVAMSRSALAVPAALPPTVSTSRETPAELVARLSARGAKRLYIDGGRLIQAFLRAGLVDDLTVTLVPILLGAGRPLFGPLERDVPLRHVSTRSYDCGFVQHQYRVG